MPLENIIMDARASVKIRYDAKSRGGDEPVRLFRFDSSDDANIKAGREPFLITCDIRRYPELRLYFAQRLTAFVARINQGCGDWGYHYWHDTMANTSNRKFVEILRGLHGPSTSLFIIPVRKVAGSGRWVPEGGVKFLRQRAVGRSAVPKGTLNLIMGWDGIEHNALCIDEYYGGTEGNDIGAVKEDL